MQSLLLQQRLPKNPSLQCFAEYRDAEARGHTKSGLVAASGDILEYETLELRIHPPNVNVDNQSEPTCTVVTIDSANRPGTLVEVVQHFTELGLRINKARISSDGGWFHDMFTIVESSTAGKVRNQRKLSSIVQMLSVNLERDDGVVNGDESDDVERVETTVFELGGQDQHGLLADVTQLLTSNGCDVRSAAVWTHRNRVAFVLSVTEKGRAVSDELKLTSLRQLLTRMMDARGQGVVKIERVRGEVHHERRLHCLLLLEEENQLQRRTAAAGGAAVAHATGSSGSAFAAAAAAAAEAAGAGVLASEPIGVVLSTAGASSYGDYDTESNICGTSSSGESLDCCGDDPEVVRVPVHNGAASSAAIGGTVTASTGDASAVVGSSANGAVQGGQNGLEDPMAVYVSPKHSRPEVSISRCNTSGYWLVSITCKDRSKLLFDTVCTLADLDYDVYHATIDSEQDMAMQEFYVRPRLASNAWDNAQAERLKGMLESSIQRRFPKGLKVHVHSVDRFGCLAAITRELKSAGLTITRAKVKTYASNNSSGHTFYVMDRNGGPPDRSRVEAACFNIGGKLVEPGQEERLAVSAGGSHRFSFSFLHRQWNKGWGGSPCSSNGSA